MKLELDNNEVNMLENIDYLLYNNYNIIKHCNLFNNIFNNDINNITEHIDIQTNNRDSFK